VVTLRASNIGIPIVDSCLRRGFYLGVSTPPELHYPSEKINLYFEKYERLYNLGF